MRVLRRPPEETEDYPGLYVHDHAVTGSIRCGGRLPLWAFASIAVHDGWDAVEENYSPTENYGYTATDLARFVCSLLEQRGEFARLMCVLADVERRSGTWWDRKAHRRRVRAQLRRCLAALEESA